MGVFSQILLNGMRGVSFLFLVALTGIASGQKNSPGKYDSLVIETIRDTRLDFNPEREGDGEILVTGRARLLPQEAAELHKRIFFKESYGASQAVTPVYDTRLIYYSKGKITHTVEISLLTNNLFASFPLEVQRQGDCLCEDKSGYCCSAGGISREFKNYLVTLIREHQLFVDDFVLEFGNGEEISTEEMQDLTSPFDLYVVGSDPQWSIELNDSVARVLLPGETSYTVFRLKETVSNSADYTHRIWILDGANNVRISVTLIGVPSCACNTVVSGINIVYDYHAVIEIRKQGETLSFQGCGSVNYDRD